MSEADVLVIPVSGTLEVLDSLSEEVQGEVKKQARARGFQGQWSEAMVLPCVAGVKHAAALVSLGKDESLNRKREALRRGMGSVIVSMRQNGWRSLSVSLKGWPEEQAGALAEAAIEGSGLANYRYTETSKRLREQQEMQGLKAVEIIVSPDSVASVKKVVNMARNVLRGVELARDLVNRPADRMSPAELVKTARTLIKGKDGLSLKVYNRKQAEKMDFNAFLAVAQGSDAEPYVIHYVYKPKRASKKRVVLVGKGITFDSGGLSIKPSDGMENMKIDMAGAAAVLGVLAILPVISPKAEVHGIIAACENMPSGKAYRPGDVLTAKSGTTIEVINTDAEGRLTLADMLTYAAQQKPTAVIDLATLTGACMVALGETVAGLFSNNKELAEDILAASFKSGEASVQLPLPEEYRPLLDSDVADIKNLAGVRWGGAITAGLFLREFAGDVPWAHIDIAGPSFAEGVRIPYWQPGATGYGVRLLTEYLRGSGF